MNSTGPIPQPNIRYYNIEDWMASYKDSLMPPFQVRPVIVFTADLDFIEFAKRNNYFVPIKISGTGLYDGEHFATVDNFYQTPNICKLYGKQKYTLTVQTVWRSFPFKLGKFELLRGIIIPQSILKLAETPRIILPC